MPQYITNTTVDLDGKIIPRGQTIELPEERAAVSVKRGWLTPVPEQLAAPNPEPGGGSGGLPTGEALLAMLPELTAEQIEAGPENASLEGIPPLSGIPSSGGLLPEVPATQPIEIPTVRKKKASG